MLQKCFIHSMERLVFCKALEQDSCTFESGHPALPGTQSWAHRARSTKPRAQSWEHGARSMEPGAQNRAGHMDLGTQSQSTAPGPRSQEQGVRSMEQTQEHGAGSTKPGAWSWEHRAGTTTWGSGWAGASGPLLCSALCRDLAPLKLT